MLASKHFGNATRRACPIGQQARLYTVIYLRTRILIPKGGCAIRGRLQRAIRGRLEGPARVEQVRARTRREPRALFFRATRARVRAEKRRRQHWSAAARRAPYYIHALR